VCVCVCVCDRSEVTVLTNKWTKRFCWKHTPRSAMLHWWKSTKRVYTAMKWRWLN